MEIGGRDLTLLWEHNGGAQAKVLKGMARIWENGVWHGSGGPVKTLQEKHYYPIEPVSELFVYENIETLKSWDEQGRTEDNEHRMVYFIFNDDAVTFVTGEDAPVLEKIVALLSELSKSHDDKWIG